ncbi:response regulator [Pontibacter litorisediminis]|uniref:response regulator n=1 Tax=Pontibacter litorisediminis TaxID=1846260 RepID=UPI0023EC9F83|nr:response regulator [Pontibacter litorisediminis]
MRNYLYSKVNMSKIPCILLVDDDETTNYVNALIIKKSGLTDETLIAYNGKEALEIVHKRYGTGEEESVLDAPLLILLDINMPIMDGLEFMECFDALGDRVKSKISVIVLTTSNHPTDMEKMKQFGVHSFINKPLRKEELEKFVALT